jgi:hypothetical protein
LGAATNNETPAFFNGYNKGQHIEGKPMCRAIGTRHWNLYINQQEAVSMLKIKIA